MAYTPATLSKVTGSIGGTFSIWHYTSTDAVTAVRVDGYISDGKTRGMKKGDLVIVVDNDASPISGSLCWVTSVATSGTSVDLSDGVAVTATDTD